MREEVSAVAFRLFAEQGFDATTVEQIAAEAGLSRATFFRYFGTKDDVVLDAFARSGHEVTKALRTRPDDEHPWTSLRRSFDVITDAELDDPEGTRKFMALLSDACALMTRQWEKTQGWESQMAPEIARRLPDGSQLRAHVMAAAAISCLDAATDAWTAGGGEASLAQLLDQAMTALGDLNPA
nr:TetR family transcriptional regulator [Kineococcus aurantiacus]